MSEHKNTHPLSDDPEGMCTPWPLHEVLKTLCEATAHLLKEHNCDCHAWEMYHTALQRGTQYVDTLLNYDPKELVEPNSGALTLANTIHRTYERLAPKYGFETRTEFKPFDPRSKQGKLLVAVCHTLLETDIARQKAIQQNQLADLTKDLALTKAEEPSDGQKTAASLAQYLRNLAGLGEELVAFTPESLRRLADGVEALAPAPEKGRAAFEAARNAIKNVLNQTEGSQQLLAMNAYHEITEAMYAARSVE